MAGRPAGLRATRLRRWVQDRATQSGREVLHQSVAGRDAGGIESLHISVDWGLHLTGVVQVGGPPRTLRWRALQAWWMSARRWRGRGDLSWALTGDDVAVADRVVADGELEHPVEDEPAALRAAAVEAEHELVQVALQVRLVDRALMGAQKPPPGQ